MRHGASPRGNRGRCSSASPPQEEQNAKSLNPSLDRLAARGVSFAGSGEERPPKWNGRPDGAGEAAVPQQPYRGCLAARGSTLTSWRSGRLERSHLGRGRERGPGRRVPKTERADGAGAGVRACGYGPEDQDRIGSSNSNTTASEVRGHHTQRRLRATGDGRLGAGAILRNRQGLV